MPYKYTNKRFTKGGSPIIMTSGKETILAQVEGVDVGPQNNQVFLDGNAVIVTVAESSQIIIRLRRESFSGTEIAKVETKPGASGETSVAIQGVDKPGETSGTKYVITGEDVAGKASESKNSTLEATW